MSDRLRVLYLSGWEIEARGQGAASFVYEQIEALSARVDAVFVEPRLVSAARVPWRLVAGPTLEPITDLWPRGVAALTARVPRLPERLTGRGHLEDLRQAGPSIARAIVGRVGRPDLVHAHVVLPAGMVAAAIAEELRVPLLIQEHSAPFEMHLGSEEQRAAARYALERAAVVGAVGPDLAARIAAFAGGDARITVVPNLVRTDLFAPRPLRAARSELRLLTVASLGARKGLAELLHAVHALKRAGVRVSARIIGEGPERVTLERLIAALGLQADVALPGARTRADVAAAMAEADIYVCSSHTETFGLAPAEALAAGRPVVTTRCGGPEAFVDDSCGAVVAPGDPAELERGIRDVAGRLDAFDPARLHRRIADRFGPDAFRARFTSLYREMLAA